jgi:hypothetical protein
MGEQAAGIAGRTADPSGVAGSLHGPTVTAAADSGSSDWVVRKRPAASGGAVNQPPLLRSIDGGADRALDYDAERLRLARLATARGLEEAVKILAPASDRLEHAELAWYEARFCEARRLAGLPPVRLLQARL